MGLELDLQVGYVATPYGSRIGSVSRLCRLCSLTAGISGVYSSSRF